MKRMIVFVMLATMSCLSPLDAQHIEDDTYVYSSDEDILERVPQYVTQTNYTIQGTIRDTENIPTPDVQVLLQGTIMCFPHTPTKVESISFSISSEEQAIPLHPLNMKLVQFLITLKSMDMTEDGVVSLSHGSIGRQEIRFLWRG